MNVCIALDAMGGDHGPSVVVPAAKAYLQEHLDVHLILVGDESILRPALKSHGLVEGDKLRIQHASQVVAMDELPSHALRNKKDSSMRIAINLVKQGEADACVSAGNTGALMATARFVLKTLPGIDRPAIISALPTTKGHTHMLDLGANVDSSAEHLFQFAVMASVVVSAVDNVAQPSIGLLNIGAEAIKGNETVKEAAHLLSTSGLNYIGFVEGDDIYKGKADVIVCDGFVGNVALKTSEGVAHMISTFLKQAFSQNALTKLAALTVRPILKSFARRIDPRIYNGASLVGLQGIVIKSHGGADVISFANAIKVASLEIKQAVPQTIDEKLQAIFDERQQA